jgi:DNA-binding beta-propeller fold protein YncE
MNPSLGGTMFRKVFGREFNVKKRFSVFFVIMLTVVISGCATQTAKPKGPIFFPPPPDLPRVQYLTSFSGSEDLVEKKSSTLLWIVGKDEEEKTVSIYKPYGVTVNKGKIYVCDLGGRIIVIEPDKKSFTFMDGKNLKGMKKPLNVVFDKYDNMYIADAERKLVLVFDARGGFMREIGHDLKLKPGDVAVDEEYVYVLDMSGNDIKLFDRKTGDFARSIGKLDENKIGLALPTSMTFDSHGAIYVTNITASNVVKLDKDGHLLSSFGKLGDSFGDFARPKGIAVDSDGRIFVVDNGMQQVDMFNDAGRLLMPFGAPGLTTGSLNLPVGIAITKEMIPYFKQYADPAFEIETLVFVTNQFGNAKVSVYGVGRQRGSDYGSYEKPAAQQKEIKETDKNREKVNK